MKHLSFITQSLIVVLALSCTAKEESTTDTLKQKHEQQIKLLTQKITEAEFHNQLQEFLDHYEDHAIIMPEYQVTLSGRSEVHDYYAEMFKRQHIKTFQRQPIEFIHLKNTIVEIGTFEKEYTESAGDSIITLRGKYWHIWALLPDGNFRIKGEAFGYFHSVDHSESLILSAHQQQPDESEIQSEIPFELKAYNALMEKGVQQRNAMLRTSFFTDDAIIYPFADTIFVGMNRIKPYLIAYSSYGTITIDSVMCYTYAYENLEDYIIEYAMFKVKWSRSDGSGKTEGKGIRIWKRMDDQSLRLYREIGTHNNLFKK
ncbi:MAG: hypothetical protein ABI663_16760 [Chryseolinea sp.]